MKPETNTLSELFRADVRYMVPLYQRPYVWKKDTHWRPLWQDVIDVVERQADPALGTAPHFLGAVVLDHQQTTPGEVTQRLVIDGQQRLATLQLLLSAVALEADHAKAAREARLLRNLTLNDPDVASGDARFKVWPTNANRAAFRAVMSPDSSNGGPDDPTNTIHEAHAFFRRSARAWSRADHPNDEELVKRFDALRIALSSLLNLVSINLEPGDNAQVIFETLNARGTPLLAMDLVKNALFYRASLAGLDTDALHDGSWQPQLGDDYWRKEQRQGRLKRPRAELFLMHWLAMKLGRIVPATELFSEFRAEILDKTDPAAVGDLIEELCADAANVRSFDNQPAGSLEAGFFATLDALDTSTVLPVALLLFRTPDVSTEQRRRALGAIESWLVRRMLAGLTAKNYNKTSADLLAAARRRPEAMDQQIVDELSASSAAIATWPTDDALIRILVTRPMYGWVAQPRLVMVLSAIELERRRRSNKMENVFTLPPKLTLEHLMPQKWREHWDTADDESDERSAEDLKLARDAVLHRIGNLTLTSGPLNSSLSNSPWPTKAPALHAHSLLALNAEVSAVPAWTIDDLNRRGYALAREICAIWPSPSSFGATDPEDIPTLEQILADAAAAAAVPTTSGTTVPIAELVRAGFLEEGETLIAARTSVHDTVVVLGDGRLECGAQVFDTPSPAAVHCAGTSAENGWTFWMADRDGELVSLKDIRTQYVGTEQNGAATDRHEARRRYWNALLDLARSKTDLHAGVSPSTDSWVSAGAGYSGVHYIYETRRHDGGVHLYLENPDAEVNHRIFEALAQHREAIEAAFGGPLSWDAKPGCKRCAIGASLPGGYADVSDTWPESQPRIIDAMIRLCEAMSPHLDTAVSAARS